MGSRVQDFVQAYAPKTGRTKRWDAAPLAACYCEEHTAERRDIFAYLKVTCPMAAATSHWMTLHPEVDEHALSALAGWVADSNTLYARECRAIPGDAGLCLARAFCVDNKNCEPGHPSYFAPATDATLLCTAHNSKMSPKYFAVTFG